MRKRDDPVYLEHILECISLIEEYLAGDVGRFLAISLVRDGCLRQLQIMAESTQRLSPSCKTHMPEIDWSALSAFRNILVHDYLGEIDFDQVAGFLRSDLPLLAQTVSRMMKEENHE